jgi:hypothetical protein
MGQRYCVPEASKAGQRKQEETGIVPNKSETYKRSRKSPFLVSEKSTAQFLVVRPRRKCRLVI